jgi:hypothetical protein
LNTQAGAPWQASRAAEEIDLKRADAGSELHPPTLEVLLPAETWASAAPECMSPYMKKTNTTKTIFLVIRVEFRLAFPLVLDRLRAITTVAVLYGKMIGALPWNRARAPRRSTGRKV